MEKANDPEIVILLANLKGGHSSSLTQLRGLRQRRVRIWLLYLSGPSVMIFNKCNWSWRPPSHHTRWFSFCVSQTPQLSFDSFLIQTLTAQKDHLRQIFAHPVVIHYLLTWRIPFVVKSNAAQSPPVLSIQLIIFCLWLSARQKEKKNNRFSTTSMTQQNKARQYALSLKM